MSETDTTVVTLEPPDRLRCQCLRPNKTWSPFNLGPADVLPSGEKVGGSRRVDRRWRCNNPPVCIVEETRPNPEDGLRGTMSLCGDCFVQACLQMGDGVRLVEQLIETPETRT